MKFHLRTSNKQFYALTAFVCSIFVTIQATAQKSGKVEYDIEVHGLTPEMEKGAAMLFNSKMTIAFADSNVRQDYKMGELSTKTTIINKTLNRAIYYENGMNGKIGIFGNTKEIMSIAFVDSNATVQLVDESKNIMGFKCMKALYTFGSGEVAEYWYTTELPVSFPKSNFFNPLIPGIPLEFSTAANGYRMKFKANNWSDNIPNVSLYFNPAVERDYKIIDFKSYMEFMTQQAQPPKTPNQKEPTNK